MKKLVLFSVTLLVLGACASMSNPTATATLAPSSGQTASGTVTFTQMADGSVEAKVSLTGVPPGVHGFHVHEKGDCADNGGAAGMHFNPTGAPHGGPDGGAHHAGDFGNVEADASGNVNVTKTLRGITVSAGAHSIVGRAVILHEKPDDFTTQPTGNAAARIACGVVQSQ